jgi:ribonucleotide monophosphatase NagD (HAD superfamily)
MGGDVRTIGKPDPAIYAPILAGMGVARERVLAVGDSLRTDIAGARAAGIAACWVLGGIHGAELAADPALADAAAAAAGLAPVAAIPAFVW